MPWYQQLALTIAFFVLFWILTSISMRLNEIAGLLKDRNSN